MSEQFPHQTPEKTGWIEVISGCMFSGKTEELIRRLRRAKIAKQKVIIFKPQIDNRYAEKEIVSHNRLSLPSEVIDDAGKIPPLAEGYQVIGIDEAQFFSETLIKVANDLADAGKRVIIAGLDMDYRGVPFEPMPQLMAVSEYVTKTLAICVICGNPADRTQRNTADSSRVVVGAADIYEARCRKCHTVISE